MAKYLLGRGSLTGKYTEFLFLQGTNITSKEVELEEEGRNKVTSRTRVKKQNQTTQEAASKAEEQSENRAIVFQIVRV